jgi:hypothetical protein
VKVKMAKTFYAFILTVPLALTACKKGVPEVQSLRKLNGFQLDQSSVAVSNKLNPQFSLSGKCNEDYSDIEVSFDGGHSWTSVQKVASAASLNCSSTRTFQLTFNSVSAYIRAGSAASAGTWLFHGVSDLGNSEDASLNLMVPQKGQLILAGSNTVTSGALKLTSRVGGTLSTESGGYILKSTIKAR